MQRMIVRETTTLLPFLLATMTSMTRSSVKERLRDGAIAVNGAVVTRHDHALTSGDAVVFGAAAPAQNRGGELRVLFSDARIVVVDKPAGMLSVATEGASRDANVMGQLGRMALGGRFFPVHRLDRETTGVLLVARDADAQAFYERHWDVVEKSYLAMVSGRLSGDGTIDAPLLQDKLTLSMVVGAHHGAQHAVTHWRALCGTTKGTLLEVKIDTGRKHQIRAHLAHVGHPVLGDGRYGAGKRSSTTMCLHARTLEIPHPDHSGTVRWEGALPAWASAALAHVVDTDSKRSSTPAR
jgi:23S rRNA pseudouridine1911/1915/1917 synthase